MATTPAPSNRVTIGPVRLSFVHLATPRAPMEEGQAPKYQAQLILPKSNTKAVKALFAAEEAAKSNDYAEKVFKGKVPKKLASIIKDYDALLENDEIDEGKERPELEGCYYLNVSNRNQPTMVDQQVRPITDIENQLYSGAWVMAALSAYAYSGLKKGVTFGLEALQLHHDDDRLDGGGAAAADSLFVPIVDEDDDEDDDEANDYL